MIQQIVQEYKKAPKGSKIYLGSDSVRFEKSEKGSKPSAFARISIVAVIHLGSKHGCKVIGETVVQRVYDNNLGKPMYRMMLEVYEVTNLYQRLIEEIPDANIEIHLDINPDTKYGSSCAAKQAAGYVLGMCNVVPILKPNAWAASTCADLYSKKLG